MNDLTLDERIEAVWRQIEALGYQRDQFAVDRYGINAPPNAPERTLLIARVALNDTNFQVICGDHRVYERNYLVTLEMLYCRLRAAGEWRD